MTRLVNPTSADTRRHQRMKFTFLLIIGFIVILSAVSVATSNANTKDKLLYWRQVDKAGDLYKLCDQGNLIYFSGRDKYGKSIFVLKDAC